MTDLHFIVPEGIDDPARPSGGNTYGRRVIDGLATIGWTVSEHAVAGEGSLARAVSEIPDGAIVLLDGLIASPAPEALVPHAGRLRQVVLVHMPFEDERERQVLDAAAAVVTTSRWTRRRLMELYALGAGRLHVAEPGVDAADLAPGTVAGGELLCVAAVTRVKGQDVLLDALASLTKLSWRCTCAGSLDREPAFAGDLRRRARRVRFVGPLTRAELDGAYACADLLVVPSRAETYGMVVTEALAHGLPVLAADVGGVPEALGDGGLLVAPEDPAALAGALRRWLEEAKLREHLRQAARERRASLRPWAATVAEVARVLEAVREPAGAAA